MGIRKPELLSEKGQTVVEYILLLAVSASLVVTFYHSSVYKRLFGSQGSFGKLYKQESEFGYRHAFLKGHQPETNRPKTSARDHASYFDPIKSETRFFGPNDPYPTP